MMSEQAKLMRRDMVAKILSQRGDTLVVTGLGSPNGEAWLSGLSH